MNQLETKRTIQRINKTKSQFFEKMNKIYKPLAKLIKMNESGWQSNSEAEGDGWAPSRLLEPFLYTGQQSEGLLAF